MRQNLWTCLTQHNSFTLRSTPHRGKVNTQRKLLSALVSSKAGVSSTTRLSRHSTRSLIISNSRSSALHQLRQCHRTCLLGEVDPLVTNLYISIRLRHQDSLYISRGTTMLHLHHQGNHPSNLEKRKRGARWKSEEEQGNQTLEQATLLHHLRSHSINNPSKGSSIQLIQVQHNLFLGVTRRRVWTNSSPPTSPEKLR